MLFCFIFQKLHRLYLFLSDVVNVIFKVDFRGLDGYGGPLYVGSGCFHRRDVLLGKKFSKDYKIELKWESRREVEKSIYELEENSKGLASSSYEENTQWGKEVQLFLSLSHT